MCRVLITASVLALSAPAMAEKHEWGPRNTDFEPAFEQQFRAPLEVTDVAMETETLANGLEHPWGIATLPDGAGYLVTERPGRLRHVTVDGTVSEPIEGVPTVLALNQGGLLDVALSPTFGEDRRIFLTYAKPIDGSLSGTAAASAVLSEDLASLSDLTDVFVQEPPSPTPMHYGSRIVFDGEGHAFVTTGEHSSDREREFSQDLDKTYGKVIRVNLDGSIPDDNPFVGQDGAIDTIWSYGHRNIQGAAMGPDGTLWTIEHGPAGGDELNRTEASENYGWPLVSYGRRYSGGPIGTAKAVMEGTQQPTYFWDPVIAPGGMMFHEGEMFSEWNGDLLIGGLVAKGVVRLSLDDEGFVTAEERVLAGTGRVRDVEVLEDGSFLMLIDAEDGRIVQVKEGS